MNASRNGLRQSVSEYEATICKLQSELSEMKEHHQEAKEEVCGGWGGERKGKGRRRGRMGEEREGECGIRNVCNRM